MRQQLEIQSSNCEMMVNELLRDLVIKTDEAQRCCEMISRLSQYQYDYQVPAEITEFVGHYTLLGPKYVSNEDGSGFLTQAGEILKKVFAGLWAAIKWIIEKLIAIFRWLFDRNYRAIKDSLELQRNVIILQTNAELVSKFEGMSCNVVARDDINSIIMKSQSLISLMKSAANLTDANYVNTLVTTYADEAAVKVDIANLTMTDGLPEFKPMMTTTFSVAGWSFSGYLETLNSYVGFVRQIEELRGIEKQTKKDADLLKKRIENSQLGKEPVNNVQELQKEAAAKVAMVKILGYSIAICIRRSDNVFAFMNQIFNEMKAQSK